LAEPLQQIRIVLLQQLLKTQLLCRCDGKVHFIKKGQEQQIKLKHAAPTAPAHAIVFQIFSHRLPKVVEIKTENYTAYLRPACRILAMNNVIPLTDFGFLAITGRDALKFLQGYTTCDLAEVLPGKAGLGATCNIQGRMLSNYRIAAIDQGYLLRMHKSLVAPTRAFLNKYIVFSKAVLVDVSADYECFGVLGDMADTLNDNPLDAAAPCINIRINSKVPRFECWCPAGQPRPSTIAASAWLLAELDDGYVWLDASSSEEFIPQMLNLQHLGGVSFKKGCYLGQEIVARMQYRGEIKRKLYRGSSPVAVAVTDKLYGPTANTAGRVVSCVGQQFLAVIQVQAIDAGLHLGSGEPLEIMAAAVP
jgi:tRNA-modifying protein YgfZ